MTEHECALCGEEIEHQAHICEDCRDVDTLEDLLDAVLDEERNES